MSIHPVILCGGAGRRLWPASRSGRAKQFLPLVGGESSFEATVSRVEGMGVPVVVTGGAHLADVRRQLAGRPAAVLVEPEGRDSGPAIAAAMAWIFERDPEGVAVILASDHHVADAAAFRAAVTIAVEGAKAGRIVTLGVTPTAPSSAYGYIAPGAAVGEGGLNAVARFTEKPDAAGAAALVAAGALWNSGNFVAGAAVMIGELEHHAPEVLAAARAALVEATTAGGVTRLGPTFARAPKISIDYAVMEKTDRAAVLPVSFGWSDLGAWDAVWAASEKDAAGNAVSGNVLLEDADGNLIRAAPGRTVALVGMKGLAVIVEEDAVLVCDLAASQQVKAIADRAGAAPPPPSRSLAEEAAWFSRWLKVNALPAWWALGADHAGGGFFDALDAEGAPVRGARRSRVQTRQTWVYAQGRSLGWSGPWREAAAHGAAYLSARFVRGDGLHRTLVAEDGAPVDDAARLYDQAFALLALAARGAECEAEARGLLAAVERAFGCATGGFAETVAPRFASNPLMHLFEAALAWCEAGGADGCWRALAQGLGALALTRLIDPGTGAIAEIYDGAWRADPASEVWPGHQFEWAWLMLRWRRDEAPVAAARGLYAAGARGVLASGVTANVLDGDRAARLWPQTERLKAALSLAELASAEERTALEADALSAAEALRRYLDAAPPGLWIDLIDPDDVPVAGPAPASSLYHIVGAVKALAAYAPRPSTRAAGGG